jgi:NTP pyrophosphatase (non-canonical NTP hydrolase)
MNTHAANVDRFNAIMSQITTERGRQDAKWGEQNHDFPKYLTILMEELGEASKAFLEKDITNLRTELIQCAAVTVAILECGDRNGWFERPAVAQHLVDPRSGKDRRGPNRRVNGYGRRMGNLGHLPERRTREVSSSKFVGRRDCNMLDRRKADRRRVETA